MDLFAIAGQADDGGLVEVPADFASTIPGDCLLGVLGIALTHVGTGRSRARMTIGPEHLNQRGITQGGALVALADAAAGWASYASVEHGRFTTLSMTVDLLRPTRVGDIVLATAAPIRLGRRTLVLDVEVACAGKAVARFGCTQLVLGPG